MSDITPRTGESAWPDGGKHLLVRARNDKDDRGYRKLCANPGCHYAEPIIRKLEPKKVGNEEKGNVE